MFFIYLGKNGCGKTHKLNEESKKVKENKIFFPCASEILSMIDGKQNKNCLGENGTKDEFKNYDNPVITLIKLISNEIRSNKINSEGNTQSAIDKINDATNEFQDEITKELEKIFPTELIKSGIIHKKPLHPSSTKMLSNKSDMAHKTSLHPSFIRMASIKSYIKLPPLSFERTLKSNWSLPSLEPLLKEVEYNKRLIRLRQLNKMQICHNIKIPLSYIYSLFPEVLEVSLKPTPQQIEMISLLETFVIEKFNEEAAQSLISFKKNNNGIMDRRGFTKKPFDPKNCPQLKRSGIFIKIGNNNIELPYGYCNIKRFVLDELIHRRKYISLNDLLELINLFNLKI